MTKRLYLDDAYLQRCDATVTRVEPNGVVLDQTILYAESGGQAADHGVLRWDGGEARVVDAQVAEGPAEPAGSADSDDSSAKRRRPAEPAGSADSDVSSAKRRRGHVGDIIHTIEGPSPPVGSRVRVELDWPRRWGLMRHHTAAHLFAAVVYRDFHAKFTGGQLYPDRARLDIQFDAWTPETAKLLQDAVNTEAAKGYTVSHRTISRDEFEKGDLLRTAENLVDPALTSIRLTDIETLDVQADGGTHVKNTRDVGRVVVDKTENKGKGHRRIAFHCE